MASPITQTGDRDRGVALQTGSSSRPTGLTASTTQLDLQVNDSGTVSGPIRHPSSPASNGRNGSGVLARTQRPAVDPVAAMSQLANSTLAITSMTVKLMRLPADITTRQIHRALAQHNLSIARIEIRENVNGLRNGDATVSINPAPSRWPPWSGPAHWCTIDRSNSPPVRVPLEIQRTNRLSDTLRTPVNSVVPRQWGFTTQGLRFGMMANDDTMWELPQWCKYHEVKVTILFYRMILEVTFKVVLGRKLGMRAYKIPIKFSHIKKIIRVKQENGQLGLVIQLPSPPEVSSTTLEVAEASHDDALTLWQERDSWVRQLEITKQTRKANEACAQLHKEYESIDIGRWTTYYVDLPPQTSGIPAALGRFGARLNDWNVELDSIDPFHFVQPGLTNAWTLLSNPTPMSSWELLNSTHIDFPFEVRYQLEACVSQGLLNEYSIDAEFLEKLNSFDVDRARMMLEGVVDHDITYHKPMDMFKEPRILYHWPHCKLPSQAAMVRKAIITPTAIIFKTPGVELTNRVLRKYSDLMDRFLRVQFTDELTFGKIWSDQGSNRSNEIYTRVLRVLRNGIVVGGRHYKILAWSNSQFREHGAFFFSATDHVTCEDIREWMGDLTHIRSVGKFAARMGQCFTTTRQVGGISVPTITAIDDISRRKDGEVWNFTDGVGKISSFLAAMITVDQGLVDKPSCFQFRMGGCKGVLVEWPDVPANEVHIRPSQEKFKAPYNGLETIKVSTFSQATLNKQIIPILNCLGVEDQVFLDLLDEELAEYKEAMDDSTKAAEILRMRVDENQTSLTIAEMIDTFMDVKEPFVWTLLHLWQCWALQRLKHKAAISVKKSAFLFGCVDELGVLRGHSKETEGKANLDADSLPQIFVQVPREGTDPSNSTNYRVVTGLCVVGRNPSLHPGDVRVVQAVNAPGLHHLKNVVVFPQTGDRDIPSMCSGGDLDGDDFFVLWDERLLPKEWSYPPMNHDDDVISPGLDGSTDITIDHMCQFFSQYMQNDSLGLIATAHVAWADKVGPKHRKCIKLAQLHSQAVDYIKSGHPATMPKSLNPKEFPHFMERTAKKVYRSVRPLGRIYSQVSLEEFTPAYEMPFDHRILTCFQLSTEELENAKKLKAKYDVAMRRLMGQHERPISEFEVWSTFVLSKPRVGTDYKLQETIGREIRDLKTRFRKICGETGEGTPQGSVVFSYSGVDLQKLDRFVATMYTVTYDEVQTALRDRSLPRVSAEGARIGDEQDGDFLMPLISFPWLFHKELARVASGGTPPVVQKPRHLVNGVVHANTGNGVSSNDVVGDGGAGWDDTGEGDQVVPVQTTTSEAHAQAQTEDRPKQELGVRTGEVQKLLSQKEGAESDAQANAALEEHNGVRTASGKLVKRGEVLDLFDDDGKAINRRDTTVLPSDDLSGHNDESQEMSDEENEYNAFDELAKLIGSM